MTLGPAHIHLPLTLDLDHSNNTQHRRELPERSADNMVLQEIEKSSETSFIDPAPNSDTDTYANGSNTSVLPQHSINFNPPGTPAAVVDLSPYVGFVLSERQLRVSVEKVSQATVGLLKRPARQDEAEAVVHYTATVTRNGTICNDLGLAVACTVFSMTRHTYLFPGWQPGKTFNADAFGPLRGRTARFMWQGTRLFAWTTAALLVSTAASATWGVTVLAPTYFRDPRIRDILAAMRRNAKEQSIRKEIDQAPGQRAGETFEMARQRSAFQTATRDRNNRAGSEDEMSPTNGAWAREAANANSNNGITSGTTHETSELVPQRSSDSQANSGSTSTRPPSQGSAWDKLRQQALSQPDHHRDDRDASSAASGLDQVFPAEDDLRSSRARAQREFDEQVERERKGGDFGDKPSSRRGL
ncbi:uncharacterized protein K489DRAFT_411004 [Dissoconium aciculare CBS 342.82]|uniref:Uncharacterized protein n=1 Tax=Dissoconium aciculare CBS 342.82 TaxID=1314786 RepID=A0A6J3M3P4_9PEZI|nr:uncharacterized protein K489DRAFT_411004 [Dissoconium aciculare CBS 342.82]KAF1821547.1 hypothetical protein K489DRAFT_411004 [Dissoconium aciculare CBS 342.82]